MVFRCYDMNHTFLGMLSSDYCTNLQIDETLENGYKNMSFSIASNHSNLLVEEGYLETSEDEFVIRELNKENNDYYFVQSRGNIETLERTMIKGFESLTHKSWEAANLAVLHTGWTIVNDIDSTSAAYQKDRTIRLANGCVLDVLNMIRDVYEIDIWYDTKQKQCHLTDFRGKDLGYILSTEIDMNQFTLQSSTYDFYTRIYPYGKDSLSIASITCTTITLTIVAIAMIVSVNVRKFTKDVADTLTIIVFVEKDATQAEIDTVKSELLQIDEIKADELEYKDKEKIKEENLEKAKKGSTVYTVMSSWTPETNPLEPEFIVSVKDIKYIDSTADKISKIPKVKNVKYSESVVNKMIPLFSFVKRLTIAIIVGLVLVTMFLIWNTIKITIFARRSEIEIMRLVGTSNAVVKLPFVIEGLFLGIIGSIIPIIVTIWGYTILYDKMEHHLFSNVLEMVKPMPTTLYISGILLVIGGLVGMIGSYGTVRKYLKI